jgi:hypothetical protein
MAKESFRNIIDIEEQKILDWVDASYLKIDKLRSSLAYFIDNRLNFEDLKRRN